MDLSLDANPPISTTIHEPFRPSSSPVNSNAPPPKRQKVVNDGEESPALPSARKGKARKKAPVSSEATSHLTLTIPQDHLETGEEPPSQSAVGEKSGEKPHLSPSKDSQADGSIRCICGTHWDDGQMVQCDECQTWQHTRCYRVDFHKLTEDALWVCVVCDEGKWGNMPLDSEWANRTQKNLQEKERFAQYAKQLEERASRGGASRRGRGGRRAAVILDTSSALISTKRGFEDSHHDFHDDVDTWRKVYVPLKRNVVEGSLLPKIQQYLRVWGPTSRYATNTCKSTRGWTTARPIIQAYEVGVYDISSRSLPIVVSSEELTAAKEELWVAVRSRHCPPPDDPAMSRPKTPGIQRLSAPPLQQIEESSTPAPTPRNPDNSYRNIFLQATTNPQVAYHGLNYQSTSLAVDTTGQVQVSRSTASPAPENRKGAPSPVTSRGRKATPQFPDPINATSTSKTRTDGISTVDPYTPQQYTLHARQDIPARTLIALYPSHIVSHETYVGIPSNQYLRIGTPKSHVRMFPPPLDVTLDSRVVGGIGRFARSGCWPNSAVRGVIIPREKGKQPRKRMISEDDQSGDDTDETLEELVFGIFSLRSLEEGEEVVLAWEWDDSHRVHRLPRLLLEEARSLLCSSPSEKSDDESRFFIKLSQTLSDAFGGCACVDSNIPLEEQLGGISGRCAIEELSRWAERQKHAGSVPPTRSGSTDLIDEEQTEPDEAIDLSAVESTTRIPHSHTQRAVTRTPQRANPPPIDPSAPWLSSPHSDGLSRGPRNPASLGFITQPLAITSTPTHRSLVAQHPLSQSSLSQPPNHTLIVSPTPRPTDIILSHDNVRLSSATPLHRTLGPASIASILNQVDTHPLSRPTSRSAPGVINASTSQIIHSNRPKLNPLQGIWSRSPTASALAAREGELDEDVLKRSLGISLGPLIGLSRGVRYEDARGMGGPGLRAVSSHSKASNIKRRSSEKRKRDEKEEYHAQQDEDFSVSKRQRLEPPILPPFARRRKPPKHPSVKGITHTMDVDEASATSFPFTFSVPIADPTPALSDGHHSLPSDSILISQSGDTAMTERPELVLAVPLSPREHSIHSPDDHLISASSMTSNGGIPMAIASILSSPPTHNFDRTLLRKRMKSTDSPIGSRTPDQLPNEADLADKTQTLPMLPKKPDSNGPTTVAPPSHDTASDVEIPTPPTLQGQPNILEDLPSTHSIHNDYPQAVEIRTLSSPINGKQSIVEDPTLSRPITPIPMVLQADLMSRSWHSPAPSSVQEDGFTERVPSTASPQRNSITPKAESVGILEPLADITISTRAETPPPVLVKGRLVTPPSRDVTPDSTGSKEAESDSNDEEDDDTSSLSDEDEDEDEDATMQSKSSSNDSDSLTPAPSPTPLPVEIESTPDLLEQTVSPAPSLGQRQMPLPPTGQEASIPSVSVDAIDMPMIVEYSVPPMEHDVVTAENHVGEDDDKQQPTVLSVVHEMPSPPGSEKVQTDAPSHETSTIVQQSTHPGELSGASTAHVRRRTLQGYASRRKKDPLVSPSVQTTHSSLLDPPSSPSPRPSRIIAEGLQQVATPSTQEYLTYDPRGSPIPGNSVVDKPVPPTQAHSTGLPTGTGSVSKGESDHLPEQQTDSVSFTFWF
ncbi:hypothetical protein FRC15_010725 [Serendipita sp. 397]|nr:hypothetical protein FRC15_010725 [Serendipita sp. 397]